MKPTSQTVRGNTGNCFAACVASLLEMPIEQMPNHYTDKNGNAPTHWLRIWQKFLRPFGLGIVWLPDQGSNSPPPGYAIAGMRMAGDEDTHAVICYDGEIKHDPLPGEGRFCGVDHWYVLTVLDPKQRHSTYG